jgi:hypothetical protein
MEINKFNKAKDLIERIEALDAVCEYARTSYYTLLFESKHQILPVDEALKDNVINLAKELKKKLEKELKDL